MDVYHDLEPPCKTCWPGIHEFNEVAVKIYQDCSGQYIFSSSGAVALDYKAVSLVFDIYEIDPSERMEIWHQIQTIVNTLLDECRREAEEKAKQR